MVDLSFLFYGYCSVASTGVIALINSHFHVRTSIQYQFDNIPKKTSSRLIVLLSWFSESIHKF